MLKLTENADLQALNTLGIREQAQHLVCVESEAELRAALALAQAQNWPITLLGGGSNVLLAGPLPGLVIVMRSRGRRIVQRSAEGVVIEGEAGENWHALVNWSLDQGLSGLENLSLIPGTLGAAPVQNIGAYGVELKDSFDSLEALDRETGQVQRFTRVDCRFAYRDSLFKQAAGRYVILRVRLRLRAQPVLKVDYAPLAAAWQATGLQRPDARVVSALVCRIRSSKLPDPALLGNAGSFFKNPLVSAARLNELLAKHPQLPHYPQPDGQFKVAAGWMIEQAGWKGYRVGNVGVHSEQALVLVNFGTARGWEVSALANNIKQDILMRFGVELEMEPQRIG
ncbi:UDP-N-acetylmuramate dehydrogenase [Halopseudomonas pelagia]|uniref:UDP-N-acetylmuramate dehydrogenase n=1 Tax=Halopseudomonas pelagia TaxID=553151 RepID=UPI0003A1250F|nr:UDP-N-acetylmuramate dehydrogenase [Halopseudomonas pelagia]|tara:strand:- start:11048 stop:12067 length:1020 start_codon:yes stop_codon:yes gene_type:complete